MNAQTTVHLLRHGEVHNPAKILYGRLPGYRLSDEGVAMADTAIKNGWKTANVIADKALVGTALVQLSAHSSWGHLALLFLLTAVPAALVAWRKPGERPGAPPSGR